MKENRYLVNILHIALVGLLCLAAVVARAFDPVAIFLHVSIPMLVLLAVIPMAVAQYINKNTDRPWLLSTLLGGVAYTVLPLCAGWDTGVSLWKLCLVGLVTFGITDILYRSMMERLNSGAARAVAPISNALLLYLASQCLQGLLK